LLVLYHRGIHLLMLYHQGIALVGAVSSGDPYNKGSTASFVGLARTIYIYTVHIQYFWQGNHQLYGHIRSKYTVLANPSHLYRHGPLMRIRDGLTGVALVARTVSDLI